MLHTMVNVIYVKTHTHIHMDQASFNNMRAECVYLTNFKFRYIHVSIYKVIYHCI